MTLAGSALRHSTLLCRWICGGEEVEDAYKDPAFNPAVARLTGFRTRSILCMALVDNTGATVAVIQLLNKKAGGAFSRDLRGSYRYPCNPGGPSQREEAIRLGVNIVLYATCTDYKSDRAHVETLERSRRKR